MLNAIGQQLSQFFTTYAKSESEEGQGKAEDVSRLQDAHENQPTQKTRLHPGQKETHPDGRKKDSLELSQEAEEIRQLQIRDKEVRAHEAAHAAAGGAFAGSPSYKFERGPDGRTYATDGEVSIDLGKIQGDPEATLKKAEQIKAAALAPAEPSGQDLKVAQKAQAMAAEARMELAQETPGKSESRMAIDDNNNEPPSREPEGHRDSQQPTASKRPSPSASNGAVGVTRRLDIHA